MDSYRFIEVEKANALARHKRLNKVFRLMEFLILVALISWSTTYVPSGAFKVVSGFIYACSSCYILNQHVLFLLGNFALVLCYLLSGNATESVAVDSATDSVVPQGFEDNYKKHETVSEVVPAQLPVVDNLPEKKQTVVENKIVENEDVILKTESEEAIKQAARQIERSKRTQSARLKREMLMRPCRELRRSVTNRRKSNEVDRLSSEEFRLAVEAFILKRQIFDKQEREAMVEQSYKL